MQSGGIAKFDGSGDCGGPTENLQERERERLERRALRILLFVWSRVARSLCERSTHELCSVREFPYWREWAGWVTLLLSFSFSHGQESPQILGGGGAIVYNTSSIDKNWTPALTIYRSRECSLNTRTRKMKMKMKLKNTFIVVFPEPFKFSLCRHSKSTRL